VTEAPPKPPRRVLVVEDESSQRVMYARALRSFGYQPECVASGTEAMAALGRERAGVVVLDLHLGQEHGLDVFESIRDRHPAVSVVIVTGHGSFEAVRRAIRLDVVDFMSKPVALAELEQAVARAWARHELVETPIADLESTGGAASVGDLVARAEDLNLEDIEQAAIREALRRTNDNRKEAAELLGISERTLYYRLSQYRVRRRPSAGDD
jgi:DNA-binding NtrC family response regulator